MLSTIQKPTKTVQKSVRLETIEKLKPQARLTHIEVKHPAKKQEGNNSKKLTSLLWNNQKITIRICKSMALH
jgi:hypothetical protein